MIEITLRAFLGRRMTPSEYDQNLINFEEGILNLRDSIDLCCGTQSWSSYDPLILTTDSSQKLLSGELDGNFENLLSQIVELEEKIIECCSEGNTVSGSLVLRKDLNRPLNINQLDGNFILLKNLLDELIVLQQECCESGNDFILTESGEPLLAENGQNLILE
jgi:hypothetical protein